MCVHAFGPECVCSNSGGLGGGDGDRGGGSGHGISWDDPLLINR